MQMTSLSLHLKLITGCDEVLLSPSYMVGEQHLILRFGNKYMKLKMSAFEAIRLESLHDYSVRNKIQQQVLEFFLLNAYELSTDSRSP